MRGVDDDGVLGRAQGRDGPVSVLLVALADLLRQFGQIAGLAHFLKLQAAALGPDFRLRLQKNLVGRAGKNRRAHIAPLGHEGKSRAQTLLGRFQAVPHLGQDGDVGRHHARLFAADGVAHGMAVAQKFGFPARAAQGEDAAREQRRQARIVGRRAAAGRRLRPPTLGIQVQGQGAEHGPGVEVGHAQGSGQPLGQSAFAHAGRAVYGHDKGERPVHDDSTSRSRVMKRRFSAGAPTLTLR